MIQITLSDEILTACPDLHVLAIACPVKNSERDSPRGGERTSNHEIGRGEQVVSYTGYSPGV